MAFPLTRKARTAPLFVEEPVAVEPQPRVIPGLVEARAALVVAQDNANNVERRIKQREHERFEATMARERLHKRVRLGEEEDPAADAAATAAVADAEDRIALLQDALNSANAAVKRAEQDIARVWRAEAGR